MKLKQVGEEFAKVCEFLSQEKECELAADEMENDRKRIRTIEDEMDEASETVKGNLRSSKKIKTN